MKNYYSARLSAERLKQCYEVASPRIRQYLHAEVEYLSRSAKSEDLVLDVGCGYGRIMPEMAAKAKLVAGIDISIPSLLLGQQSRPVDANYYFVQGTATLLPFRNLTFDLVTCIQNGISAFGIDQQQLILESMRVTKKGGTILFSSYSESFWTERLEWFQQQAKAGLLGEIDMGRTGNGVIVCKDGFQASTVSVERFLSLTAGLSANVTVEEIDGSSLFCRIIPS